MALVMAAAFCFMASNMLATPLMAGYSEELGATGAMMGLVSGMMSIVSLFCRPVAGLLSDRTSKRVLVGVGAALYLVSSVWYSLAGSPASLIAARMVNGVGFACCSVCLATWMSLLLPIRHMGAGMGLYGTMNALAMAVGPAIGIEAQQLVGYRPTFLISAAMAVCMVVSVFLVKNGGRPVRGRTAVGGRPADDRTAGGHVSGGPAAGDRAAALPTPQPRSRRSTALRLLRAVIEPRVVPLTLVFMLFALPYFANQSFLVTYVDGRHLAVTASLFFPLYAVALLVLRLALRDLFDRWPFRRFLLCCSVCLLGMLACLGAMTNDWLMLLAGIFTAASYGIMSSVTQAQAVVIAGRERSGVANSTYYIGIDLGMGLGPLVGGFLYQHAPLAWFYPMMMVVVPVALALYFAADAMMRRHDRRRDAERAAG
ncbi:MFS transporter [Bifidobacterium pullorum]|uniref:MFS transporter n=1 Tax=Bifidobacterium pullorum TaxID=78448 RepID=UPI003F7BB3F6